MLGQHLRERTYAFKAPVQNLLLMVSGLFVALLLSEVAIRMKHLVEKLTLTAETVCDYLLEQHLLPDTL